MIVLDTNVLSAITSEKPEHPVIDWLDSFDTEKLYTTSVTVFELWSGVEFLKPSARRDALEMRTKIVLGVKIAHRVLFLTEEAARQAAKLAGERKRAGKNIEHRDTLIAGICLAYGATFATRNTRDFADAGISLINPWEV